MALLQSLCSICWSDFGKGKGNLECFTAVHFLFSYETYLGDCVFLVHCRSLIIIYWASFFLIYTIVWTSYSLFSSLFSLSLFSTPLLFFNYFFISILTCFFQISNNILHHSFSLILITASSHHSFSLILITASSHHSFSLILITTSIPLLTLTYRDYSWSRQVKRLSHRVILTV